MSIASDTYSLIGIPTCLDDVEVGAEIAVPGRDYLVTVRDVTTMTRRDVDGDMRWVVVLTFDDHDGQRATHEGSRFDRVPVYTALAEVSLSASYGEIPKDTVGDLVPALCGEVARLRAELASAQNMLDESRRVRRELTPGGAL